MVLTLVIIIIIISKELLALTFIMRMDAPGECTVSSVDAPERPQMHHIQCNYPQPGIASKLVSKSKIQISIFLTFSRIFL